jgi:hypothetical protein
MCKMYHVPQQFIYKRVLKYFTVSQEINKIKKIYFDLRANLDIIILQYIFFNFIYYFCIVLGISQLLVNPKLK